MSDPITRQRSKWEPLRRGEFLGYENAWLARNVNDGRLIACVGEEPTGWHLSISFRNHKGDGSRYPTWDEIINAREALLPDDVEFAMFLPRAEEYVAVMDTCFHLHEHPQRT